MIISEKWARKLVSICLKQFKLQANNWDAAAAEQILLLVFNQILISDSFRQSVAGYNPFIISLLPIDKVVTSLKLLLNITISSVLVVADTTTTFTASQLVH